ncbi:hypothetical protein GCM10009741_69240 [Kribbella lupini]|uniref:Uncharacterized protein n=1 Tax=Kribbella lupini TaxID=291602 RepID=A0ABP4N7H4_9ACTN
MTSTAPSPNTSRAGSTKFPARNSPNASRTASTAAAIGTTRRTSSAPKILTTITLVPTTPKAGRSSATPDPPSATDCCSPRARRSRYR